MCYTQLHVTQTTPKILTRFTVDVQNDLPSFSFSSVFYDLQSLVIKSAKEVFKVKAIFDSVRFPSDSDVLPTLSSGSCTSHSDL